MQIKNTAIIIQIEQLCDHYRVNISSRYIRPLLLQLPIDKVTWDAIDAFLGNAETLQYQGFVLEDLYGQIAAFARFVDITRRQLLPVLRSRAATIGSAQDRVFRDMAVSTFPQNLTALANKTYELFEKLIELDTHSAKNGRPVYKRSPELESVEVQLQG